MLLGTTKQEHRRCSRSGREGLGVPLGDEFESLSEHSTILLRSSAPKEDLCSLQDGPSFHRAIYKSVEGEYLVALPIPAEPLPEAGIVGNKDHRRVAQIAELFCVHEIGNVFSKVVVLIAHKIM